MTVLDRILLSTREEVRRRRVATPQRDLEAQLARREAPRPFEAALRAPGLSLIAEHKRRSPSAGVLREGSGVGEIVASYERGGARALSVLTEGRHFGGSLDDLRRARLASGLPVLRKDFIVDSYQLYESAVAGADAVLLIVAALDGSSLERLHREARALDLAVLVEVHDRPELEAAARIGARLIGINNRDLATFTVDVSRTVALLPHVPPAAVVISESGLGAPDSLQALVEAGVDGVLVGETLMRAPDPEAACRALTGLTTGSGRI